MIVKESLCPACISDVEIPSESQTLWLTDLEGLLTQWLCPVHSLDVHETWQVGPHQDDIAARTLVGTVDATGLPVSPVDIGFEQGKAIRVLHR